jgi:hypothetical protein
MILIADSGGRGDGSAISDIDRLRCGGAIGAYITYRYLINKHKKVIEYLELRSQKSLAAEIEEKEDTIEKYKNKDIAREIEHDNLKKSSDRLSS